MCDRARRSLRMKAEVTRSVLQPDAGAIGFLGEPHVEAQGLASADLLIEAPDAIASTTEWSVVVFDSGEFNDELDETTDVLGELFIERFGTSTSDKAVGLRFEETHDRLALVSMIGGQ